MYFLCDTFLAKSHKCLYGLGALATESSCTMSQHFPCAKLDATKKGACESPWKVVECVHCYIGSRYCVPVSRGEIQAHIYTTVHMMWCPKECFLYVCGRYFSAYIVTAATTVAAASCIAPLSLFIECFQGPHNAWCVKTHRYLPYPCRKNGNIALRQTFFIVYDVSTWASS